MADVRAFTAVSLATLTCRSTSTWPSAVLGMAVATPARTWRAATSASAVSDLPLARRAWRLPPVHLHDAVASSSQQARQAGLKGASPGSTV
jgi:hypothetical protein